MSTEEEDTENTDADAEGETETGESDIREEIDAEEESMSEKASAVEADAEDTREVKEAKKAEVDAGYETQPATKVERDATDGPRIDADDADFGDESGAVETDAPEGMIAGEEGEPADRGEIEEVVDAIPAEGVEERTDDSTREESETGWTDEDGREAAGGPGERIVEFLRAADRPDHLASDIAAALDLARGAVRTELQTLENDDRVEEVDAGTDVRWVAPGRADEPDSEVGSEPEASPDEGSREGEADDAEADDAEADEGPPDGEETE